QTRRKNEYASGRVVVARGRYYHFFTVGSEARLSQLQVRRFIDSFQLTDGNAPWDAPEAGNAPENAVANEPMPNPPPRKQPNPQNPPPFEIPRQPDPPPTAIANDALLGFSIGNVERQDVPAGAHLVGFDVWDELFINYHIVRSVPPIYRVGDVESSGKQYGTDGQAKKIRVVAKPGYAVGAITAKTTTGIEGM